MAKSKDDEFSEAEAKARFEAALKSAMNTLHKPLKERPTKKTNLGKLATKPTKAKIPLRGEMWIGFVQQENCSKRSASTPRNVLALWPLCDNA